MKNIDLKIFLGYYFLIILWPRELTPDPAEFLMLIFLLLWVFKLFLKGGIKNSLFNHLIFFLIAYGLLFGLIQYYTIGIDNYHFFAKDFYILFVSPLIAVIISNDSRITKDMLLKYVKILITLYGVLAFWNLCLLFIPFFQKLYILYFVKTTMAAVEEGYYDPTGGGLPITDVGTLRVTSFIGGFGHIGWISLLVLILIMGCYSEVVKVIKPVTIMVIVTVGITAMICLLSRSIVLGLLAGGLICKYYTQLSKRNLAAIAVISLVPLLLISSFVTKLFIRFTLSGGDPRWQMFKVAIQAIKGNILLPLGLGNYLTVIFQYSIAETTGVDSLPLSLILKIGAIGAAIYLIIFIYLIYNGISTLKQTRNNQNDITYKFIAGFLGVLVGCAVAGVSACPLDNPSFAGLLWIYVAFYLKSLESLRENRGLRNSGGMIEIG